MADAIESSSFKEEQLPPDENKTMIWKPRRGKPKILGKNKADIENTSVYPDLEDLDVEFSSKLEALTFTELKTASYYEVEDWEKELEELERDPYNADDFCCGSFQENNLLASYSWQEDLYYTPACHHAASFAFTPPVRTTEIGQFDDADE
ncbi:coordinator of PRMT5 and differentiation stimulator [Antrostomus carolinensis]|uniref:coordinator of PRMT5 and differentiation stimulator n=1 Tax=Antrostomus carolinensis TaxID=279965 RepID=UPI0010A9814F|nr:coordinator of PRMT5 and differentiation stimulator [Antrostomus carolinensis]